jgi:hypothetical protein
MKTYPTISKEVQTVEPVYAFDKLDGSNIRAEWSRKRGFYKYGTRRRLLDAYERPLGLAIELINDQYGEELAQRFKDERVESAIAYFEFFGDNSFAGFHYESDDFKVILFDVSLYKRGFMGPKEFMKFATGLSTPTMVYHGNANQPFVQSVMRGEQPDVTFEGVVCKYIRKKQIRMFKVKSAAWLKKLKAKCGTDKELFRQLM